MGELGNDETWLGLSFFASAVLLISSGRCLTWWWAAGRTELTIDSQTVIVSGGWAGPIVLGLDDVEDISILFFSRFPEWQVASLFAQVVVIEKSGRSRAKNILLRWNSADEAWAQTDEALRDARIRAQGE